MFTLSKQITSRLDFNQTVLSRILVMRPLKRFLNHNKGEQMFCYGMYFFIKYQRKKKEREGTIEARKIGREKGRMKERHVGGIEPSLF